MANRPFLQQIQGVMENMKINLHIEFMITKISCIPN